VSARRNADYPTGTRSAPCLEIQNGIANNHNPTRINDARPAHSFEDHRWCGTAGDHLVATNDRIDPCSSPAKSREKHQHRLPLEARIQGELYASLTKPGEGI
jgi:hypothetical protein